MNRALVVALVLASSTSVLARRLNTGEVSEMLVAPVDPPPMEVVEGPLEQGEQSVPLLAPPKPSDDVLDEPEID